MHASICPVPKTPTTHGARTREGRGRCDLVVQGQTVHAVIADHHAARADEKVDGVEEDDVRERRVSVVHDEAEA
eukprot:1911841-Rhodomonas_salina.1